MKHTLRNRQPLVGAARLRPVAAACSILLIASGTAFAQDAANLDTVTVTGIRHAIETATAIKRNSDSIVEVVTSEDIGKLPESSVADSLARLPGVVGQRGPSGRTDVVSIRGMGPKFGGTVMNGREMVSSNDGRAVEFDQFPSELVSSLVVYKTPDAELVGQGLSGTVDIRTIKPLDVSGRKVSVNLRGETNSNNVTVPGGGSKLGKRFSLSYIDQFANNTIGVALGYAHLDSPAQTISNKIDAYVNPYNNGACIPYSAQGWCPVPPAGLPLQKNGGGLATQDYAAFPQRIEMIAESKKNVRDGLMATLEFKPNRDLHSQVDLFYSKFDSRTVSTGFQAELYNGIWSGNPAEQPVFTNAKTQQLGGNTIVTGGTMSQIAYGIANHTESRTDETSAFGWNTSYKLNKEWTADADVNYSRNKRDESFYEVYTAPYANGAFVRGAFNFVTPGSDPSAPLQLTPASNGSLVDPSIVRLGDPFGYVGGSATTGWAGPLRQPHTEDEIKGFRLTAKRNFDGGLFSKLDVGLNYSQRDKTVTKNQFDQYLKKDASGNFINTIPSAFLGSNVDLSSAGGPTVMSVDAESLIKSGFFKTTQVYWLTVTSDSGVHEKVTTGFAKLDIDTDVGGVPVKGNVGTQIVRTSQNSTGWGWLGGSDRTTVSNLEPLSAGKSYTDLLPSLNLVFDLKSDTKMRFGLAKTMVRPEINDMRSGVNASLNPKSGTSGPATWSVDTAGNPDLEPWRANSIDLSVEKYFGKRSYIAAAAFHKNLLTTIYTESVQRDFSNVPHQQNLTPTSNLVTVTGPVNGHGGYVEGVELSAALEGKMFASWLDGFGIQASATSTHSSIHKNNEPNQPLEGLSGETSSYTLYYEKNGFSARVNRTYRSPFLALGRDWAYQPIYTYTGAEKLVNLQFGYDFESGTWKGLSFILQVNNVTDAALVTYKSVGAQGFNPDPTALVPYDVKKFGRQLGFGVNYKF